MKSEPILELFDQFLRECEFVRKRSVISLRGYRSVFELLLKFCPELDTSMLSEKLIVDFFAWLEKRPRIVGAKQQIKTGVKNSTVATYRSKLNQFFDWLVKHEQIKVNPLADIPYPDVNYEDKKFLRKEDIEKILAAVSTSSTDLLLKKRNLAILFTFLFCGLRRSELANLKIFDLNLEKKELTVRAENSKSKRERILPLHSQLISVIKDYLAERKKRGCQTPYLFISSQRDDKLTLDGFKHLIEGWKEKSGVNFHLHQLRHTFAVNMLNNKLDIAKLKQLLGHKDIRQTASYLRCLPTEAMREDVEQLRIGGFCYVTLANPELAKSRSAGVWSSENANGRRWQPNK